MSTSNILSGMVVAGLLHEFVPAFPDPDFVKIRSIYMSEEAKNACPSQGTSHVLRGQILKNAQNQLEAFIGGEDMHEDVDLKRLKGDDEVWELRVHEFPQARLLGWFVAPDCFVVTHCKPRDRIKPGKFDVEIEKTKQKRERRFAALGVFKGGQFTDYITKNGVPK